MNRFIIILATIIGLELLVGFYVLRDASPPMQLPRPDLTGFPESTRRGVETTLNATRPHVPVELDHLADVLFAAGFYPESEACYREATNLNPKSPQYQYNLGFCLASIGDVEGSNAAFRKAIELGHSRTDACSYFLGMNALRSDQPQEAMAAFRASQSIATSRIELAQLLIAEGQLHESEALLADLQKEFPNSKRCYQLQSQIALLKNDTTSHQSAKAMADVLFEPIRGPWHARVGKMQEIYLGLGITEQVADLTKRATSKVFLEEAKQEVESDNAAFWDPDLEDYLSNIAVANADPVAEIAHLQNVVDTDGLDSYRAARLGFALLRQQKTDQAKRIFEKGIHLPVAKSDNGVVAMARELARLSENEQLSLHYTAFAEFQSGLVFMDELNVPAAHLAFLRATQADSESSKYWFWLGRASLLMGQNDVAADAFNECLQRNPHHERAKAFQQTLATNK